MSSIKFQGSTAQQLIDYARENGVDLPDNTSKNDAWAAVKQIQADLGEVTSEENQDVVAETPTKQEKQPTHYTIKVSKPVDVKLQDFTVCANGVNFQIHFGKEVKVPAVVVNILNDAVERKPAYRDMETNEWIPESFESRYSFAVLKEHFE